MSAVPAQQTIGRLKAEMLQLEQAGHSVQIDAWHTFADGLVARTIFIPAGTALMGVAHKVEHLNVCFGDIEVLTNDGPKHLVGYHVIPSLPGTERAGFTHEDTWWTTVHLNPGNERDIAKLEDALVFAPNQLQARRLALVE